MTRHVRILVEGLVQGVFFRDYTRRQAQSLNLHGTVRNLRNGDVEVKAQGRSLEIESLIQWCRAGSPLSNVEDVKVEELQIEEELSPFIITY
jgi:acylphosphatase